MTTSYSRLHNTSEGGRSTTGYLDRIWRHRMPGEAKPIKLAVRAVFLVAVISAIYPVALSGMLLIDTLKGNAEFIQFYMEFSKTRLITQLIHDWVASLVWSISGFIVVSFIIYGIRSLTRIHRLPWLILMITVGISFVFLPMQLALLYASASICYSFWYFL